LRISRQPGGPAPAFYQGLHFRGRSWPPTSARTFAVAQGIATIAKTSRQFSGEENRDDVRSTLQSTGRRTAPLFSDGLGDSVMHGGAVENSPLARSTRLTLGEQNRNIILVASSHRELAMSEPSSTSDVSRYEQACDQAIAMCDGNLRSTIKALIMANEYLEAEMQEMQASAASGVLARLSRADSDAA